MDHGKMGGFRICNFSMFPEPTIAVFVLFDRKFRRSWVGYAANFDVFPFLRPMHFDSDTVQYLDMTRVFPDDVPNRSVSNSIARVVPGLHDSLVRNLLAGPLNIVTSNK